MDHLDLPDHKDHPDLQVKLVCLVLLEIPAHLDHKDKKDLEGQLELMELMANLDYRVPLETLEKMVLTANLEMLEKMVRLAHADLWDYLDDPDQQVHLVKLEPQV